MSESDSRAAPSADPAAHAWLQRLADGPDEAVGALLLGSVWLGGFAALDAPQAVPQFLPEGLVETFDGALQRWLNAEFRRVAMPEGVTAKQYAHALADAFGLLQTLDLPLSRGWCRVRANRVWGWLQAQPSFPSRDPRVAFLRAMALAQPNRDLLDFWMALCRLGNKTWAQLALFGLRRLPVDDQGTASPGLPLVLVNGLIDYGLALIVRADGLKKQWLAELDFLSAVYPMSRDRWQARFRDALAIRSPSDSLRAVRHWLDERFPAANQPAPVVAGRKPLSPGYWDDAFRPLLDRYDSQPAQVREPLKTEVDKHLHYAEETGDSYFLVRTYARLGQFLLQPKRGSDHGARDAGWALELGQVAASWVPSNAHAWSIVARSLDALGDWSRAQAVYWYARRRFPYNPFLHTQLGHALAMRGFVDEGEAVYRAAIRRFPDDSVCWADLGHTLRVAGRLEESLAIYREAQQRFNSDPPISTALCGLLIDMGRADEARDALAWAEHVVPDDDRSQRMVLELRRRLGALVDGAALPPKTLRPRKLNAAGDWSALESAAGISLQGIDLLGEAALWRERGGDDDLARARGKLAQAGQVLHFDDRWLAEQGLWLGASEGWGAASEHFDRIAKQRPGDGQMAAFRLLAHRHGGETVDLRASLREWFEDLAPLIRVADDPHARMPSHLEAAVRSVTEGDRVDLDKLDDSTRQALRVYETASQPELSRLVQLDFLAARQLAVF